MASVAPYTLEDISSQRNKPSFVQRFHRFPVVQTVDLLTEGFVDRDRMDSMRVVYGKELFDQLHFLLLPPGKWLQLVRIAIRMTP
jgi:hypothetical protein